MRHNEKYNKCCKTEKYNNKIRNIKKMYNETQFEQSQDQVQVFKLNHKNCNFIYVAYVW